MSQYQKECVYCKSKIQMSDKSGKWAAYNVDGSVHDCRKKEQVPQDLSLELVLRKLKTVGITLDLEVLRNAVNGDKK